MGSTFSWLNQENNNTTFDANASTHPVDVELEVLDEGEADARANFQNKAAKASNLTTVQRSRTSIKKKMLPKKPRKMSSSQQKETKKSKGTKDVSNGFSKNPFIPSGGSDMCMSNQVRAEKSQNVARKRCKNI